MEFSLHFPMKVTRDRVHRSQGPGVRFSKVPIINGPDKLLLFTLKTEVTVVLHLKS